MLAIDDGQNDMAPVVDFQRDDDATRREHRRIYLRQRIPRDLNSRKSVKILSVESRDESVRRADKREVGDDGIYNVNDDTALPTVPTLLSVALPLTALPTANLETMPASTLSRPPQSTTDVLIAANPQISVSVWPATSTAPISLMTTQSVETISTVSARPRQASADLYTPISGALVSPTCTGSVQATLSAFDSTPTPIVSVGDANNKIDMGHTDDHHGGDGVSPGQLSPDAENALISVGSIGMSMLENHIRGSCMVFG